MGDVTKAYIILFVKRERKRLLGSPGIEGRIILKWIFRKQCGDMGCIHLAQDSVHWRALVNTVMNRRLV
jgi:hypothetical protein